MILFIIPGVTVGLSILDMTDWDIYRNMTTCIVEVSPGNMTLSCHSQEELDANNTRLMCVPIMLRTIGGEPIITHFWIIC